MLFAPIRDLFRKESAYFFCIKKQKNKGKLLDPSFYISLINNKPDITKTNSILQSLARKNVSQKDFEQIWTKYNYFVNSVSNELIKSQSADTLVKYDFFNIITQIHGANPTFKSINLTKTFNKLSHQLLTKFNQLSFAQKVGTIQGILQYNKQKAKAIMTSKHKVIIADLRELSVDSASSLLKIMGQTQFVDTLLLERCLDILYPTIEDMTILTLSSTLYHLGSTQKFINKDFLLKIIHRFRQLMNSQNITSDTELLRCTSSVSLIEKNMYASAPLDEVDSIYEFVIPYFAKKVNSIKSRQIQTLASIVRRSKYYDTSTMANIMDECMSRQIREMEQQSADEFQREEKSSKKGHPYETIELNTVLTVFHMSATCNFRYQPFFKYVLSLLELIGQQNSIRIKNHQFSRLVWSLCVLCQKNQLSKVFPTIEKYLARVNSENLHLQKHQLMSFYYCYIYLKTFDPRITAYSEIFPKLLTNKSLSSEISQLHENVFQSFVECGIPCLKQFNISNIMVDIFIPEFGKLENIVIDVHGYHHFLRNTYEVGGASQLKRKLLESEGYSYYFIAIDQWNLAQDKKEFVKGFMDIIAKKQIQNKPKSLKRIP